MNVDMPGIRLLYIADLDALEKLEQASFPNPWSRDSLAYELTENPLARYYGLFQADVLLAYVGYWHILEEGHIANVAVLPAYRQKGYAEYLLRTVMALALAEGVQRMTLEVRESNLPAQRLYEKLGFQPVGLRPHYYQDQESAIIMWVDLPDS